MDRGGAFLGAMLGAFFAVLLVALYAANRYEDFKSRTGLNLP